MNKLRLAVEIRSFLSLKTLLVIAMVTSGGCKRQPPVASSSQIIQKDTAHSSPLVPLVNVLSKSSPLPVDSQTINKIISFNPPFLPFGISGGDECRLYKIGLDDDLCAYAKYVIRYSHLGQDLQSKFAVYLRDQRSDSSSLQELPHALPLFVFDGNAEYFYGMKDSLLFTDVGTADIRGVRIYNVLHQQKVYDGTYTEGFWLSSHDTLAYYEICSEPPDTEKYPDAKEIRANGATPVLFETVKVSLATFDKLRTGQFKIGATD